jgi:hypothetical protein
MTKINVLDQPVSLVTVRDVDYISISDLARIRDSEQTEYLIQNWLSNRNTIEYLGMWEQLHNPNFDAGKFDELRRQAGLNSFALTPRRWLDATRATGLATHTGRVAGVFAHPDIAFEFASWISVEFKLYLLMEFQRIKNDELEQLGWDIRRNLVKLNYRIHTEAIREALVPPELSAEEKSDIYRSEADVLNKALFGQTAAEWRESHPEERGNIRDQANMWQLLTLSNLENLNAHFIRENVPQEERLRRLNRIAIDQMRLLAGETSVRALAEGGAVAEGGDGRE